MIAVGRERIVTQMKQKPHFYLLSPDGVDSSMEA